MEMANADPELTGLTRPRTVIWISHEDGNEGHKYPRFKVYYSNKQATYVITKNEVKFWVGDKPKRKHNKNIIRFGELNRKQLLDHYTGKTSVKQFKSSIKSLKDAPIADVKNARISSITHI